MCLIGIGEGKLGMVPVEDIDAAGVDQLNLWDSSKLWVKPKIVSKKLLTVFPSQGTTYLISLLEALDFPFAKWLKEALGDSLVKEFVLAQGSMG